MRETQFIGVTKEAADFLVANRIPAKICPNCQHSEEQGRSQYDMCIGMFDEEIALDRYELTGGLFAYEFLQASPWSSGPMLFIGLRISDGREFLWAEDESIRGQEFDYERGIFWV